MSPWARPCPASVTRAATSCSHKSARSRPCGRRSASRGAAALGGFPDELQHDLGAKHLEHSVGHRHARLVEPGQGSELRPRRLRGDHGAPGIGAPGHGAGVPWRRGPGGLPGTRCPGGTSGARCPGSVWRPAGRPGRPREAAADQEDIGFLAGLQDAQLGIDRGQVGDEPAGIGPGPRSPAADWSQVDQRRLRSGRQSRRGRQRDECAAAPLAPGEDRLVIVETPRVRRRKAGSGTVVLLRQAVRGGGMSRATVITTGRPPSAQPSQPTIAGRPDAATPGAGRATGFRPRGRRAPGRRPRAAAPGPPRLEALAGLAEPVTGRRHAPAGDGYPGGLRRPGAGAGR